MPTEVFTWLAVRTQQAEEAAQRAAAATDEARWLATTLVDLANVQVRLVRAVRETLRAHQPDSTSHCVEDGQRWPCRTLSLTAAALRPPSGRGPAAAAPRDAPDDRASPPAG